MYQYNIDNYSNFTDHLSLIRVVSSKALTTTPFCGIEDFVKVGQIGDDALSADPAGVTDADLRRL